MTGLKLYEIAQEMQQLEEALDIWASEHAGDITDFPFEDKYEGLEGQRNQKLLNLGAWYKSVKAEAEAYKVEQFILAAKRKVAENKMEWLKRFIDSYLKDGEKIKDSRVNLSYLKSASVVVNEEKFNLGEMPFEFIITNDSLNKTKVKEALKHGQEFEGISLLERQNLQIK